MEFLGWALLRLLGFELALRAILGDQAVQVVAVLAVCAEGLFIEEALDSAAQANLVRVILIADRPAHFTVPATAKNEHGCSGNPGCHDPKGNFPARFLVAYRHREPSLVLF
jgi:hypothetical protein